MRYSATSALRLSSNKACAALQGIGCARRTGVETLCIDAHASGQQIPTAGAARGRDYGVADRFAAVGARTVHELQ